MNTTTRQPALMLGLFYGSLAIARSLGHKGVKVYGYDFLKNQIGGKSKYCEELMWDLPREYNEQTLDRLIEFAKKIHAKIALYPLNDEWVLFLSRYRKQLGEYYLFNISDEQLIETLISKACFADYLKNNNSIYCPCSFTLSDDSVDNVVREIGYPCVLKFEYQSNWKGKLTFEDYYKIKVIHNPDEFRAWYDKLNPYGKIIAQEMIPGVTTNLYYLTAYCPVNSGDPVIFIGNKLRTRPVLYGGETYFKSVKNEAIRKIGYDFLQKSGYKGIAGMDFKYDDRDGKYKIIEVNARFGTSDGLAVFSGIDFPYIYYLDAIGASLNGMRTAYKEGCRWLKFDKDFEAYRLYKKSGDIRFSEWLKTVLPGRDLNYCVFDMNDMRPFISEQKNILKLLFHKMISF